MNQTLKQLYRDDISQIEHPYDDEERLLWIEQARSGSLSAKDNLLLSLLTIVAAKAWSCYEKHKMLAPAIEYMEYVAAGNYALSISFDAAMSAPNPIAKLLSNAFFAMEDVYNDRHLIRIPATKNAHPHSVTSLDLLLDEDVDTNILNIGVKKQQDPDRRHIEALYDALDNLKSTHRLIILLFFGLGDDGIAWSLDEIAAYLGKHGNLKTRKNRILRTLREELKERL